MTKCRCTPCKGSKRGRTYAHTKGAAAGAADPMQQLQLLSGRQAALGGPEQRARPVREHDSQQAQATSVVHGLYAGQVQRALH